MCHLRGIAAAGGVSTAQRVRAELFVKRRPPRGLRRDTEVRPYSKPVGATSSYWHA